MFVSSSDWELIVSCVLGLLTPQNMFDQQWHLCESNTTGIECITCYFFCFCTKIYDNICNKTFVTCFDSNNDTIVNMI